MYPETQATIFRLGDILYESGINTIDEIKKTGTIIDLNYD
jgi:hypothetical protein